MLRKPCNKGIDNLVDSTRSYYKFLSKISKSWVSFLNHAEKWEKKKQHHDEKSMGSIKKVDNIRLVCLALHVKVWLHISEGLKSMMGYSLREVGFLFSSLFLYFRYPLLGPSCIPMGFPKVPIFMNEFFASFAHPFPKIILAMCIF